MVFIIIVVTLIFICSAFFSGLPQTEIANPLFVYYLLQQKFIITYYVFFIVAFIVLTVIFFRFNFDKKYSRRKILFFSALQVIAVAFIGFFVSYFILIITAFVQLNIFSVSINNDPKVLGITNDKQIIGEVFRANRKSPEIIVSDQKTIVPAIAKATSGTNNFYGKYMLSAVPDFFVFPISRSIPPMMLIDNTLIITEVKQGDIEEVGPYLGYLFVKSYFPVRQVKSFPEVYVMDRAEYDQHRKEDAFKKIEKIDDAIEKIDGYISSLSASMRNENPAEALRNKKENAAKQALLDEYNYYLDFYTTQRKRLESFTEHVPTELGVFVPEDSIRLAFINSDSRTLGDHMETLVHEYLHYASYVSDKRRFSSTFFEEGLTEYFARQIIKEVLDVDTHLGYPAQVAIIAEMTDMITASELAEIYFNKDEESLLRALDRVYGDDFYVNNYILFESLQYASTKKQILKLANDIMKKIGGEPLTEKDLVSSYSHL